MIVHFDKWDIAFVHKWIPIMYKVGTDLMDKREKDTIRRLFRADIVPESVNLEVSRHDADELANWLRDPRVMSNYSQLDQKYAKAVLEKLLQVKV